MDLALLIITIYRKCEFLEKVKNPKLLKEKVFLKNCYLQSKQQKQLDKSGSKNVSFKSVRDGCFGHRRKLSGEFCDFFFNLVIIYYN